MSPRPPHAPSRLKRLGRLPVCFALVVICTLQLYVLDSDARAAQAAADAAGRAEGALAPSPRRDAVSRGQRAPQPPGRGVDAPPSSSFSGFSGAFQPITAADSVVGTGLESQFLEIMELGARTQAQARAAKLQRLEDFDLGRPPPEPDGLRCYTPPRPLEAKNGTLWAPVSGKQVVIFVHVPKCGGTALSAVLRRLACAANGIGSECCVHPGFCQKGKGDVHRVCPEILGCHGHLPQLHLFAAKPALRKVRAVTMLRDPLSRVISAWHYRCHNPNFDCFHLPGTVQWKERRQRLSGLPNVTFHQFLDTANYQNVQTRMFAKDAFPYRNVAVVAADVAVAKEVLATRFAHVGVFELFDHSLAHLAHLAGAGAHTLDGQAYSDFSAAIRGDARLRDRVVSANRHDAGLYGWARARLCGEIGKLGLLDSNFIDGCATSDDQRRRTRRAADLCAAARIQ
ncbi:hypothetical protein M885DRAFT_558114 [Pelagophyceae sp. CCMP2097]|nr:hypothetical protein M885DRAFT_558114 [Pelagophyceae sp. CCMP2097]